MFDEQAMLKNAIAAWQRHHAMTYSLLAQLTDAQLYVSLPRPGLNNFAKHYQELADVQGAYARAFHISRLDFSSLSREKDYTGTSTKTELKTLMEEADKQIYAGIDACPPDRAIDIFGRASSRADLIQTLLHHELFHHGQFYIFSNELKFDLPAEWREFWWMPKLFS